MDIAIFTNEYPHCNNQGGIATFTYLLAKVLLQQQHQVVVFTSCGDQVQPFRQEGVLVIPKITFLEKLFLNYFPFTLFRKVLDKYFPTTWLLILDNIQYFCTFLIHRKNFKFKTIHAPVLYAVPYLISKVFPQIYLFTHSQGPDELLQQYDSVSFDSRLRVRIENHFMLTRSKKIIACSNSVANYLRKTHPVAKKRIKCIPNFIDTDSFPKFLYPFDKNELLFLGRLEYRKGPDLVVRAFAELSETFPELRLTLIGQDVGGWLMDGKYSSFSRYIETLHLKPTVHHKITLLPRIDHREKLMNKLAKHPGIAILPSRYEPFGFVYIETMMTGCVTLASTEGAGKEIIEDKEEGFLVQPDIKSIVKTVTYIQFLQKKQLAQITKNAKRKVVNRYSLIQALEEYKLLYKSVHKSSYL